MVAKIKHHLKNLKKGRVTKHATRALHGSYRVGRAVFKPFFRLQFIFLFFLTVFILVAAFVAITYITYANDITTKEKIMNTRNSGMIIYDNKGQIIYQESQAREFKITPITDISQNMINATIASEDIHFYSHPGVSVSALVASALADFKHVDPFKYGGSTITQQLVKKSLLGDEKSYSRKFREIVLAVEIERKYTKNEILEMYLNSVYYGAGAYGIAEAAQTYFNELPSKLTLAQASFLAGLPNAPSYLTPYGGNKEKAIERQQYILEQMAQHGMVSPKEQNQAKTDQLVFSPLKPQSSGQAPHFSLWVRNKVLKDFGEEQTERLGYRVYTTLDMSLQKIGEEAVANRVRELARQKASNGALVAIDPKTGAILSMVGSADYNNDAIGGKFNIAVDGIGRQPGSSFKPFVYVSGFEERKLTPATILHDQPTNFGVFGGESFKPKNYDGRYRGNVTVRRALANSLNIPAVEALKLVGIDNAIDTAQRLGMTTFKDRSRYGLSLVLGGGEVHLLEMVGAYSAFANNGNLHKTYSIEKITDKFGTVVYKHKNEQNNGKQVIIPGAAYLLTNILSDNNARAEVFGTNSSLRLSRPAAAKTGTTDDYKDSWTLGYTPNLVAGAWVGNNDGTPMLGVAGALGAAPIWQNFMEKALKNYPVENFTEPEGIVHVKTCQKITTKEVRYLDNGQPYDHFEDRTVTTDDVFLKGTEPTNSCQDLTATSSGQPVNPGQNPNQNNQAPQPTQQPQPPGVPGGVTNDNLPVYYIPPNVPPQ